MNQTTNNECPCKRTKCERFGKCIECREHHLSMKKLKLPACERKSCKRKNEQSN